MPDQYYVGSGPVNLGTAQLCVLALNTAARPRIRLNKLSISFNGTSSGAVPFDCHVSRITNTPVGTAIPALYGPNPVDPAAPTSTVSALTCSTANPGVWSTAPTEGVITWDQYIPPVTADPEWFPLGDEVVVGASAWIGVFLGGNAGIAPVGAKVSLYYTE